MSAWNWGLPQDASLHGWRADWLMHTTTVFLALMVLATLVWILWAALAHGTRHPAAYDHGNARAQIIKTLCLSGLIFCVVEGNLWVTGFSDLNDAFWNFDGAAARPDAIRIEINARQWAWDVRYAGADGAFNTADDIVTLNDVRVPVGTPVVVELAASDVIHSFSLPNFRIKQDAVPGMINRLWFQAQQTGAFDIACAQHCGVNHYKMRGRLTVLSQDDFRTWSAEAAALSARAYDAQDSAAHWGWAWERPHR